MEALVRVMAREEPKAVSMEKGWGKADAVVAAKDLEVAWDEVCNGR